MDLISLEEDHMKGREQNILYLIQEFQMVDMELGIPPSMMMMMRE